MVKLIFNIPDFTLGVPLKILILSISWSPYNIINSTITVPSIVLIARYQEYKNENNKTKTNNDKNKQDSHIPAGLLDGMRQNGNKYSGITPMFEMLL